MRCGPQERTPNMKAVALAAAGSTPASCVIRWQASAAVTVEALVPVAIVAIHRPPSVRVAFAVASRLFPPVACVRGRRSLSLSFALEVAARP